MMREGWGGGRALGAAERGDCRLRCSSRPSEVACLGEAGGRISVEAASNARGLIAHSRRVIADVLETRQRYT